jgi:hypothetical protein
VEESLTTSESLKVCSLFRGEGGRARPIAHVAVYRSKKWYRRSTVGRTWLSYMH